MLLQVAALAVRVTAVGFAAVKFAAKRDSEFDEVTAAPFLASIGALRTDADDAAAAHGRALDNAASAAAVAAEAAEAAAGASHDDADMAAAEAAATASAATAASAAAEATGLRAGGLAAALAKLEAERPQHTVRMPR